MTQSHNSIGFTMEVHSPPEPRGVWQRLLAFFQERPLHVRLVPDDPEYPCVSCRRVLAMTFEASFEGIIDDIEVRPSLAEMDLIIRKPLEGFLVEGDYVFIENAFANETRRCMNHSHAA